MELQKKLIPVDIRTSSRRAEEQKVKGGLATLFRTRHFFQTYFSGQIISTRVIFLLLLTLLSSCSSPLNEGFNSVIDEQGCLINPDKARDLLNGKNLNLFIETSGSMSGFMSHPGTDFQRDIWSVVEALNSRFSKNMNIMEMRSKDEPIYGLSAEIFREKLNTGGFVSSGSTDIPEMLDSIMAKGTKNTVSILVSDLIFSPKGGNAAQLSQISTDIKKRFSNSNTTSILYHLESDFYIKNNKVERSPYYIWIVGENAAARQVAKIISSSFSTDIDMVDYGSPASRPSYSILPSSSQVNSAIQVLCENDKKFYTYGEYTDDAELMSFYIGIDLSDLPGYTRSRAYLMANLRAEASSARARILNIETIDKLKHSEDIDLARRSGFTHFMQVELDGITGNTLLSINGHKTRPDWLEQVNLDTDDYKRTKTFGFGKMTAGLEAAYESPGHDQFYEKPIEIIITKNHKE